MRRLFSIIPKPAFALWCICSALFFLLAADVRYHGLISRLDRPISERLHDAGTEKSVFLQAGTELGGGAISRMTWAMAVVLVLLRRWHYLPFLSVAMTLGGTINGKMQAFFARPRPSFPDMEVLTHPGFPSGHTATAALLFGFLIILSLRDLRSKEAKLIAVGVASASILFVAWTRVALLVHHTTDVIGSLLWCTAWLVGCHYGNIAAYRWSAENVEAWGGPCPKKDPLAPKPRSAEC
jgi:undecaprenyl-diphosphatase